MLRAKKRAEKLLLVEVADSRVENNRIVFSEKFLLSYSFYKFLRNNVCIEKDMQFDYYNFVEYVKVALRGDALCVFDRARKLQALLAD